MNLVATMLLPKPSLRLALSEIKMHPWYNLKVATQEELIMEMTWRWKIGADTSTVESQVIPDSTPAADVLSEESHRGEDGEE